MQPILISIFLLFSSISSAGEEITPHKFTDKERESGIPNYQIPASSRHIAKRTQPDAPEVVYYLSKPKASSYPIVFFCGGSSSKNDIVSIIHVHRYFLQEFLDLNLGLITAEQWGVDGPQKIDVNAFMAHYTRGQRLLDHQNVIESLKANPPKGWTGKLIFIGVSEGGPLVTSLSALNQDITLATINWSGADGWPWRDELWVFLEEMQKSAPWWIKLRNFLPNWMPFAFGLPKARTEYDLLMDHIAKNPSIEHEFMGMTYKYHADAMNYPEPDYKKLQKPFLVVAGALDSSVGSARTFVKKSKDAGANITYFEVSDMDHYVRRRPDVVKRSFDWLDSNLKLQKY